MNWLHSCKRVAELASQRLDEPLGLLDSIRLRVHLKMCGNCLNVEQQLDSVHALSTELFSHGLVGDDHDSDTAPKIGKEHRPSQPNE